jgi:hypothetical protein
MTCSKNLFKHFLKNYQTKTNKKNVTTWFSTFWKSNDFFLKIFKKEKWSNVFFLYLFFTFVQIFKPKKMKVYLNVFDHIVTFWKNYMNFVYDGCYNHFKKKVVSYLFCELWIGDKVAWGLHIWKGGGKNILFQPNWNESSYLVSMG